MARLPYLTQADLPDEHKHLLARDIALFRLMTHSPGGARAFSGLGGYIRNKSTLDGRLRELAILQVGWLAKSPYEWSHHVKIGHDFGVSDADIQALIDDTDGKATTLDGQSRAVLRAAREMTVDGAASAESFAALQGFLSNEHLTDLVLTIAFYCAVVRFLATMQVDVEPEYQKYLAQFPFPAATQ
ncbi:MAG: carboxymuconolactone decarboxylase family protein [Acetobacteraceae bacterium]|nr:carboxymuconolactone decarboxylase family protein [Acetobacteraceae bacterium]